MDFSRVESGRKHYALQSCDVGRVVRETIEAYAYHLDRQQAAYKVRVASGLPPAMADAEAVAQSLLNLVANAVKFSPDARHVEIEVESADDGKSIAIAVRDRGMGIAPEDLPHVFEPFYRSSDERVRSVRGSGLGLSLLDHMVRAHHGRVDIQSSPGEGTTITIVLPAADENGPASRPS
jgi:two-component system phosphate regulon sensor histidine kinase PhoR